MLYTEMQYLRKPFLYIILVVSWAVTGMGLYMDDAPIALQIGLSVLFLVLITFFCFVGFKLTVTERAITLKFHPFFPERVIPFEDISSLTIHEISTLEYGGWGYRITFEGVAYIMQGKEAATLVLKNKKRKVAFTIKDSAAFIRALEQSGYRPNIAK